MFPLWILSSGAMSSIQETVSKVINAVCRMYLLGSALGPKSLLEELLGSICLMEETPQTPAEPRTQGYFRASMGIVWELSPTQEFKGIPQILALLVQMHRTGFPVLLKHVECYCGIYQVLHCWRVALVWLLYVPLQGSRDAVDLMNLCPVRAHFLEWKALICIDSGNPV